MSTITIIIVVAALLVAAVIFVRRKESARLRAEQEAIERERVLRRQITEKSSAVAATNTKTDDAVHDELSFSGALSVRDEINRCVTESRWDEAINWSHHAIETSPDKREFQVKLAEIYSWSGKREEFTKLFEELHGTLGDRSELREKLLAAAKETIPDHALLQG